MSDRIVVNLIGDAERGRLAESRLVDDLFAYGGVRVCISFAFAVAAAGGDVELRGWIPRQTYETFAGATDHAPKVGLAPRPPGADDVLVVPEGWRDPLEYAQLALSPAQLWLFILAAPGLFGWPFTDDDWSVPDPLNVDLDLLARPEHFRGMAALGARLMTHSHGLVEAAAAAGVPCTYVGTGDPLDPPRPDGDRSSDVAALMHNRWAPLVERVLADLGDDVSVDRIPAVSNDEVLQRFGRSKILIWPSRVEGHATIPIEARAMGCVPVALDTNTFAAGLTEEDGAVTVGSVDELAPAIRRLLADPRRLEALSARGRAWASEHEAWGPLVSRAADWLDALRGPDSGHGGRAAAGASFRDKIEALRADRDAARVELDVAKVDLTEATHNQERLAAELAWLRGRKLVEWAYRLDRFIRRR
jgi:Glycosyl transferases group 1